MPDDEDMSRFRPQITTAIDLSAELVLKASPILASATPPRSVTTFLEQKLKELIEGEPVKRVVGVWPPPSERR
jgi:hypothetical protein